MIRCLSTDFCSDVRQQSSAPVRVARWMTAVVLSVLLLNSAASAQSLRIVTYNIAEDISGSTVRREPTFTPYWKQSAATN